MKIYEYPENHPYIAQLWWCMYAGIQNIAFIVLIDLQVIRNPWKIIFLKNYGFKSGMNVGHSGILINWPGNNWKQEVNNIACRANM